MRVVLQQDDVSSSVHHVFKTGCGDGLCFPYILASLYAIMGLITLIQLARIHFLAHINQWTMQKGFQTLNVVICLCRAASLFAYEPLHRHSEAGIATFVIDFTSLLFFSTYTLLVLFWADIVHVAMDIQCQCSLLTIFVVINVAGYVSAALFWSLCAYDGTLHVGRRASAILLSTLDVLAIIAFGYYGSKLLALLKLSPIRSVARMNKIREVSSITVISVISFTWKAVAEIVSTLAEEGLTYSDNDFADMTFYVCTEIITMGSALVLLSRAPRAGPIPSNACVASSAGSSSRFHDPYYDHQLESPMIPYHHLEL